MGQRKQMRAYARFVPAIGKFKEHKRITKAQLGLITKAKRQLRHTENLRPLTEKQTKKLKDKSLLVGHGVRAIRLRNTANNAKVRVKKGDIIVTSNGRSWEYHPVKADIDTLADYGIKQLQRKDVQAVALWTNKGRADETFDYAAPWIAYLHPKTGVKSTALLSAAPDELDKFINGIAVLLKEKGNV